MKLYAAIAAACALAACVPSAGGQCSSDRDCAGGAAGSFCAAGICQGATIASVSGPAGPLARNATIRLQITFQRLHGTPSLASARLLANGVAVQGSHDASGAIFIEAPLTFAPARVEGPVSFNVVITDDLGHETQLGSSVLVDDRGPRISIAGAPGADAGTVRGAMIDLRVTLTDEAASTLEFSLVGSALRMAPKQSDGTFLVALDTAQAGPAATDLSTLLVATDALGNTSQQSVAFPITRLRWKAVSPTNAEIVGMAVTPTSVIASDQLGYFISVARTTGARAQVELPSAMIANGSLATDGVAAYSALRDGRICKLGFDGSVIWCCDSIGIVSNAISVGPFPSTISGGPYVSTVMATSIQSTGRLFAMSETSQRVCEQQASLLQTNFDFASPAIAPDGTVYAPGQGTISVGRFDGFAWDEASYSIGPAFSGQPAFYPSAAAGQPVLVSSTAGTNQTDEFLFPAALDGGVPGPPSEIFDGGGNFTSLAHLTTPAIGEDGAAYFADQTHVFAMARDGGALWQVPVAQTSSAAPVAGAGGVIYSAGSDGVLTALGLDGGTLWTFQTDGQIVAPVSPGCDRTLYLATRLGTIYAIAADAPGLANSSWPREGHDIRGTGDARRPNRSPDGGCVE